MAELNVILVGSLGRLKDVLIQKLDAKGYTLNVRCCDSRLGLREQIAANKVCDWLVISDTLPSGPFDADTFVWIHEEYNLNVIPLISEDKKGTGYMVKLYEGGILNAIFVSQSNINQLPDNIVMRMTQPRAHEPAQVYYGITGRVL